MTTDRGSMPVLVLGWEPVSKVLDGHAPFCAPHHADALKVLACLPVPPIATGKSMLWAVLGDMKVVPVNEDAAVPTSTRKHIHEAARRAAGDALHLIDDLQTLDLEAFAGDIAEMINRRAQEVIAMLRLRTTHVDNTNLVDELLKVELDRGSRIIAVSPPEPENTRRFVKIDLDDDGIPVRVEMPVRNLPPAIAEWRPGEGVHVRLPGIPFRNPLAEWKEHHEHQVRVLHEIVFRRLQG